MRTFHIRRALQPLPPLVGAADHVAPVEEPEAAAGVAERRKAFPDIEADDQLAQTQAVDRHKKKGGKTTTVTMTQVRTMTQRQTVVGNNATIMTVTVTQAAVANNATMLLTQNAR